LIIIIATEISFAQLNPNNLVQFSGKDGLPSTEVREILQDHLGYIWIPTINGLARFDGYKFKRYLNNPNDSTTIKGSIIGSLFEDSKNNIWVGSAGYIEVYNPYKKSFNHYDFHHLIENPNFLIWKVQAIIEGSEGRIYFGIGEQFPPSEDNITNGLLYYDEKDDRIKRYQSPDSLTFNRVYALTSDSKGNIWFVSSSGIYKIDKENKLAKIPTFDEEIIKGRSTLNDIKSDKEGVLWITGTNSKFFSFDPITEKINSYSLNGLFEGYDNKLTTYSIAIDKSDNIWLGSERGLSF
jgi:ligand-binding sensor domain-containing protein